MNARDYYVQTMFDQSEISDGKAELRKRIAELRKRIADLVALAEGVKREICQNLR